MSYTIEDVDNLVKLLRMDLSSAQAKLTDLRRILNSFDLPTKPDDPDRRLDHMDKFLRNGGYQLTDPSIVAELEQRGIPDTEHDRFLDLAQALRGEAA